MIDVVKILIFFLGFFVFAPVLGLVMSKRPRLEDFFFFVMILSLGAASRTGSLMVHSVEEYRGYVKGFEFTLTEILALALIISTVCVATGAEAKSLNPETIRAAVEKTVPLLERVRALGLPVAHTKIVYAEDGSDTPAPEASN